MLERGLFVWLLLFCGMCLTPCVESAKVLLLPINMGSHILYFGQAASALAETGHEATLYVPSNNKPPQNLSPKVRVVIYQVQGEINFANSAEWAELQIRSLQTSSPLEWLRVGIKSQERLLHEYGKDCAVLFEPDVFREMASVGYDLAVIDPINFACLCAVPYKLNIPHIALSVAFGHFGFRVPHFSSIYPHTLFGAGSRMTFLQRVFSFGLDLGETLYINRTEHFVRTYVPERPPVSSYALLFNSTMWWYLYDVALGHPKSSMPDTLQIGDIMVRPPRPLEDDYRDLMEASPQGAILVSMGSHFDVVPEAWLRKFCHSFKALPYTVIWKLKTTPPCDLPPNVHLRPWVPQNDLLAHPNLVLFVTHCGYNSLLESTSHGKPVVGFPISLDQPNNAKLMEEKGLGEALSLTTFTAQELTETIKKVVGEPRYRQNAQRLAKLLKDKPEKPAERVSYWVNHLMEYGDSHLKSVAKELNLFQFLMIDVYLFLLALAIGVVLVLVGSLCCLCKCVKRLFRRGSDKKEHRD